MSSLSLILAQGRSCIYKTARTALSLRVGLWVDSVVWTLDRNKFNLGCEFGSVQGHCKHSRLIMA